MCGRVWDWKGENLLGQEKMKQAQEPVSGRELRKEREEMGREGKGLWLE